jgi:hypothetical protein
MPMRRASRCSKAVRAFPLERPSAWHAMRAEWWCSPHQALGARWPDEALESLQAQNDGAGVQINAHTAMLSWQGERLDVGWAISVLHPLAAHPLARPPAS